MAKELLNTKDTANYLGVSVSTIYRMEEQGILVPSKTPGGQRRFNIKKLDEYIEKIIAVSNSNSKLVNPATRVNLNLLKARQ